MKKFFSFLIICSILCSFFQIITVHAAEAEAAESQTTVIETEAQPVILPTDQVSTEDIVLYSSACCVMDADTGEILYYKNMDDRHYPASITKVLTGLLVIENSQLDDKITFSQDNWDGLNYYNDMNIGILDGEQLSVEAALHAILLSSANEVCNGAAEYISGSVKDFCRLMNERAAQLGCTNTHFANPNGLHDKNHFTSAHDMALIAREAIQNPIFRKITGTYEYTVEATNLRPEGFVLGHKHRMLMYTNYHYNACIGGKTGYTEEAKNTLVTFAEKDGMTLVCVVMENADGHIYPDTIQALDYCFDNYEKLTSGAEDEETPASLSGWSPLPFEGFNIDTLNYVSDHTGDIVIDKEASASSLTHDFEPSEVSVNLAPYRTLLQSAGTIVYTEPQGLQPAGNQPIYASANTLDINALSKLQSSATDNDAVPTFIQLHEQPSETGTSSQADLRQRIIAFTMDHLMLVIPAGILAFVFLTFLIIWLRRIFKRRLHRRNYERLRSARLEKNDK